MARPEQFPLKFQMAISEEMDAAINEWRRAQSDLPNRSEAIRRLIHEGIARSTENAFEERQQQKQAAERERRQRRAKSGR